MNKIIDELKLLGYQKKVVVVPLNPINSKSTKNIQLQFLFDEKGYL